VVIHDETIDRTTDGSGNVGKMTFSELREFDAGVKNGFAGQKIPSLREVLELVKANNLKLNIEIKSYPVRYEGIEEKIINLVTKADVRGNVILSSFNHKSMVLCKKIDPLIKTGLLYMQPLYKIKKYTKTCGADALHPHYMLIAQDAKFVLECKNSGIKLNAWTVDEKEIIRTLAEYGINSVITNFPDMACEVLNEARGI
jgi:glycerophosphoryl diester phosphodiesterase